MIAKYLNYIFMFTDNQGMCNRQIINKLQQVCFIHNITKYKAGASKDLFKTNKKGNSWTIKKLPG